MAERYLEGEIECLRDKERGVGCEFPLDPNRRLDNNYLFKRKIAAVGIVRHCDESGGCFPACNVRKLMVSTLSGIAEYLEDKK